MVTKSIDEIRSLAARSRQRLEYKDKVRIFIEIEVQAKMGNNSLFLLEREFWDFKYIQWPQFIDELKAAGYNADITKDECQRDDGLKISW